MSEVLRGVFEGYNAFMIGYFVVLNAIYTVLVVLGWRGIADYVRRRGMIDYSTIANSELTTPISIVVPAYNEQERLAATLAKIASYIDAASLDAEIIVVDDGSKDRTVDLAEKALSGRRGRVVRSGENRGKGYAVRRGELEAGPEGRYP